MRTTLAIAAAAFGLAAAEPGNYNGYETSSSVKYHAKPTSTSSKFYTTFTDDEGHKYTVTKPDQYITLSSTHSIITHYATTTEYAGGYAAPTGYAGQYKNASRAYEVKTKTWHESYDCESYVDWSHLGPAGIPGYHGSGHCGAECWKPGKGGKPAPTFQPCTVKECYGGKCSSYVSTATYGLPAPSTTSYSKTGVYTIPDYTWTVSKATDVCDEKTSTAEAGKPVTYGGYTTTVTEKTTVTVPYGAWETHNHKTTAVVKYSTHVCPSAGKYTVVKPTITSWPTHHVYTWPHASHYPAGHYHHHRETITITKPNQPYTVTCQETSTSHSKPHHTHHHASATKSSSHKGYPTSSSSHKGYPASSTHKGHPTSSTHKGYPTSSSHGYPTHTSSAHGYGHSSSALPTSHHSKPHHTKSHHHKPTKTTSTSGTPEPSSDYGEPAEEYGTPYAGYVKRGGMLERRKPEAAKKASVNKRVILV